MTATIQASERVGIFGGSFNPPHLAHLIVAELVREQFALDRILWIPTFQSPLKDPTELAGVEDRLAMARLAVAGNEAFAVSEVEIRRKGVSYTLDTVRMLQDQHPEAAFHLIIGSDSLADLDRWHAPDELLELVPFIVFRRPGHVDAAAPEGKEHRVTFAEAPLLTLSSTDMRRRVREGRSIRYMVPDAVCEYVISRGLYRDG